MVELWSGSCPRALGARVRADESHLTALCAEGVVRALADALARVASLMVAPAAESVLDAACRAPAMAAAIGLVLGVLIAIDGELALVVGTLGCV